MAEPPGPSSSMISHPARSRGAAARMLGQSVYTFVARCSAVALEQVLVADAPFVTFAMPGEARATVWYVVNAGASDGSEGPRATFEDAAFWGWFNCLIRVP